ncbi:major facilitator superfamily transporter [Colletotrichum asianum]|uniref:Major facilitator superfamily transporter n=1 Tax=Colletotrichum asianum TaxID=702518 RepID=A0A8H3WBX3_9PEZI|nr:major facilitator superfamily transporter [Colletotrichum asianum]
MANKIRTGKNEEKDVEMLEDAETPRSPGALSSDKDMERRIVRTIDIRLMPFTALIYLLCYLDRSNIGNAKILNSSTGDSLLDSTGMTNYQYTIALMVFLVSYTVFEAPSNLALKVFSPNKWLGFLIIGFGSFCTGIGGANSFASVTVLRFFLGAFESGVFAGMIFYMSFWYRPEERAFRIAIFLGSATLAGAFGGVIAYGVGHLNGVRGLEGWRWLFIVEGVPSGRSLKLGWLRLDWVLTLVVLLMVMGVAVFLFMPSYPENAKWLSNEEKSFQIQRLGENSSKGNAKLNWPDAKQTLKDLRLWVHYFTYLCLGVAVTSLSLFAPTIVSGLGYKDLQAQLFTVPPYAIAYIFTLAFGVLSDRKKSRGIVAGTTLPDESYAARYAFLCISTAGTFAGLPSLCAWVSDNVRNTTAGSLASGLNIAFTGPGQIIGVWIYRAQDKPFYRLGHAINAGFVLAGALLSFGLSWHYMRLNRKLVGTNATKWVP